MRTIYVATAFSLIAFVGGYALAGSLTVSSSGTESANGNYEPTGAISWWSQSSVGLSTIPSSPPTAASTTVATPTSLASASQSYMINTGSAGDLGHYFKMSESSSACASTELEIVFTVSTGASPSITTVTIYVETQSSVPASTTTFTFYYDLGSPASGSIVLNSVQQISQVCASVGTCP